MKKGLFVYLLLLSVFGSQMTYAAYPDKPVVTKDIVTETSTIGEEHNTSITALSQATTKQEAKKSMKAMMSYGGTKQKWLALVLAFFLGAFGVHSFYMGQTTKGYIQLGSTLLGIGLIASGVKSTVTTLYSTSAATVSSLAVVGAILISITSIWAFVDFVRIIIGSLEPEEGFDS